MISKPMLRQILVLSLFSIALTLSAQTYTEQTPPEVREQWYEEHVAMKDGSLFKNLPWQFLGPTNISGRMTDVAVVAPKGENYTIYVAGATGGVWRTQNEGTTWEPIFEHGISTSIGEVTIAPSNQEIIWIGTGEANIFRSSHAGAGVYKSIDGGETWEHKGLTDTKTIPRIVIHPDNPDVVYVASNGNEWTDNPSRGLYLTTDGGENWEKIFYVDEHTGVNDLVMHPTDPDILYLSTWQRVRRKWNDPRVEEGYDKSSVYKTVDGGKTWTEIDDGLVEAKYRGRIGIDLCMSEPDVLYAFIDNYEVLRMPEEGQLDSYGRPAGPIIKGATVYRTDNGGKSWQQVSEENRYMERLSNTYGWVFGQIRVDPNNADKIYVMGLALNMSEDGGKSFRPLRGMHGDHHGLWIDPDNSDYLVNVNDGGVAISYDGENFRTFYDNLALVQFFNAAYDMGDPIKLYGSIQDHGSFSGVLDLSRGRQNIPAVEWERAPGGEGTRHNIDPTDPNTVYSSSFYGRLSRTHLDTEENVNILPQPEEGELPFRGQWLAMTTISPHNPYVIYHGMNYLFRSMNRGDTWERISPDLTYNNPDKYGDIPYQTIFAISESPFKFGQIYVGTDDGRVHRTDNHGMEWVELTKNIPVHQWISKIVASEHTEGTVYLTQNGKRDDDFEAYVWMSEDFGTSWQDISANIPCGPVNVIMEDPKNEHVLYVGTDLGVYVSLNGGQNWQVLANDIPTTFVHDIVIHPREDILIAASEGRGMYAMDARPIQQMNEEILAQAVHLFNVEPGQLPERWWQQPSPANICFALGKAMNATIKIMNADGKSVHEEEVKGVRGINLASWDLRVGAPGRGRPQNAEAGEYTIVVETPAGSAEGSFMVKG